MDAEEHAQKLKVLKGLIKTAHILQDFNDRIEERGTPATNDEFKQLEKDLADASVPKGPETPKP